MRRRLKKHRLLIVLLVAAVAATSAYAFTNSVAGVNPPNLGSGSGSIGKYTLGTPVYNLDVNNPRNLDSVTFTLAEATASTVVRVRVLDTGSWFDCDESGAPTITCAVAGITTVAANGDTLTIIARG